MKFFNDYFLNSWPKTRQALLDLSKKSDLVNSAIKLQSGLLLEFAESKDWEEISKEAQSLLTFLDLDNELSSQLKLLSAAVGVSTGVVPYTPEEMDSLRVEEELNWEKILYTLADGRKTGKQVQRFWSFIKDYLLLDDNIKRKEFTWEGALLYAAIIQAAWSAFPFLLEEERGFLLQTCLYKGVMLAVPVRELLKYYLFDTLEIYDYVINHGVIMNALRENHEMVFVGGEEKFDWLSNVIIESEKKIIVNEHINQQLSAYLKNLYGQEENGEKYVAWLREVLEIFYAVQQTKLIEEPLYKLDKIFLAPP